MQFVDSKETFCLVASHIEALGVDNRRSICNLLLSMLTKMLMDFTTFREAVMEAEFNISNITAEISKTFFSLIEEGIFYAPLAVKVCNSLTFTFPK